MFCPSVLCLLLAAGACPAQDARGPETVRGVISDGDRQYRAAMAQLKYYSFEALIEQSSPDPDCGGKTAMVPLLVARTRMAGGQVRLELFKPNGPQDRPLLVYVDDGRVAAEVTNDGRSVTRTSPGSGGNAELTLADAVGLDGCWAGHLLVSWLGAPDSTTDWLCDGIRAGKTQMLQGSDGQLFTQTCFLRGLRRPDSVATEFRVTFDSRWFQTLREGDQVAYDESGKPAKRVRRRATYYNIGTGPLAAELFDANRAGSRDAQVTMHAP